MEERFNLVEYQKALSTDQYDFLVLLLRGLRVEDAMKLLGLTVQKQAEWMSKDEGYSAVKNKVLDNTEEVENYSELLGLVGMEKVAAKASRWDELTDKEQTQVIKANQYLQKERIEMKKRARAKEKDDGNGYEDMLKETIKRGKKGKG